ncbi:uncharacterized protein LOC133726132 [Rosa rugosa]|uniref:uncharacterized protein LOC133726132 n=1 Tax=Rosa rugosa TaxID=74645 RepID=UPI002B416D7C|nr:uncharacterized protein LOC133726132 [Rosa rugosa]
MSVLEYPDAINAPELQVWNNAAFDDNEGSGFSGDAVKASWSFESDCSKENLSPVPKTPVFAATSVPFKPLNGNSRRLSVAPKKMGFEVEEEKGRDLGKIDSEIEEIEKEIGRLNSRLELLKLEKAQKAAEKRGRVVAAKFMEPPKQSVKNSDGLRKIEESLNLSARPKVNRRGMSLGPSEIIAGAGFRRPSKLEITPVQKIQDRRKSCFWKLQDIDELRVTKERGKSTSLSPKSRKTASKIGAPKQAATSIGGSKRPVKKEDKVLGSIEPKKLFKEGEKSVPNKKPVKAGRVVASRYNQIGASSAAAADGRKRSLPDDDKEDGSRCEKKRVSLVGRPRGIGREGSRSVGPESRMKKRWEIPSEVVVFQGVEEDGVAQTGDVSDVLPKIRTVRCVNDTPRGSGPAKRVADLVGMKKYFSSCDEFCQELSFAEEEDGEEE